MNFKRWFNPKILAVIASILVLSIVVMQSSFSSADDSSIRSPDGSTPQRTDVASTLPTSSGVGNVATQATDSPKQGSSTSANSTAQEPAKPTATPNLNAVTPQQSKDAIQQSSRTSNTDAKVVEDAKLTLGKDGLVYYDGRPLLVGTGDQVIPDQLEVLMKQGVNPDEKLPVKDAQVKSLPPDKTVVSMTKSALSDVLGLIFKPSIARAGGASIVYGGRATYGLSTVGYFTVNGIEAFCIQHPLATPSTGTPYGDPSPYNNDSIARALYYGWNGPGNIFGNDKSRGYVVTSLVLSRLYSGVSAGGTNIVGYSDLWNLANNGSIPSARVSWSNTNPSVNVKNDLQVSDQTTLNADGANSVTVWVPSGITLVNDSTGARYSNSNATVNGGQTIHLEASLSENLNYYTGSVHGSWKSFSPFIVKPSNSSYQTLGFPQYWEDPQDVTGFSANFFPRTHKVDVYWKDKYNDNNILKQAHDNIVIGQGYSYDVPPSFNVNNMIYDRIGNDTTFSGTVGDSDISKTFYYRLERTITVNYLDSRTNKPISDSKVTQVHQGDSYSETHPSITGYNYGKETGDPESGTVGANNLTINYYYSKPLATVKLNKLRVYTAKASEGLPVRVNIDKVLNYTDIPDLTDKSKKIVVMLFDGSRMLGVKDYTASDLPSEVDFKIPSSGLTVNSNSRYTVRLTGYNSIDFDVPNNAKALTTTGYTSFEGKVTFDPRSNDSNSDSKKYVVMTEITPTTSMKSYYETFNYSATPLANEKSGYGVSTDVKIDYTNELGTDYQYGSSVASNNLDFSAPSKLQDSYLDYPVNNGKVTMPMLKDETLGSISPSYVVNDSFQFPHVNVERQTGKLFTDKEVTDHDSRIQNDLRDGGNKFYSPIWVDLNTYNVDYETNSMGVNKVTLEVDDSWDIYAQMFLTMDSKTKSQDEIAFIPVNPDKPFNAGIPSNWTPSDIAWLKY